MSHTSETYLLCIFSNLMIIAIERVSEIASKLTQRSILWLPCHLENFVRKEADNEGLFGVHGSESKICQPRTKPLFSVVVFNHFSNGR
jgi:hypothetical protein